MNDVTVQILCIAAIISLGIGAGLKKHREGMGTSRESPSSWSFVSLFSSRPISTTSRS